RRPMTRSGQVRLEYYADHAEELIHALKGATTELPRITIRVCEEFFSIAGEAAADIRTRTAAVGMEAGELLLRAYSQSREPALRARCLDVIDRMAELGVYGIQQALVDQDR